MHISNLKYEKMKLKEFKLNNFFQLIENGRILAN